MNRRKFLLSAAGTAVTVNSCGSNILNRKAAINRPDDKLKSSGMRIREVVKKLKEGENDNIASVLREEILENPGAVFIIMAGIKNGKGEDGKWKPCNEQMERFGQRTAELVFRSGTARGGRTFIKPNMVGGISGTNPRFINSHCVHPYFTVGLADILQEMGNTNIAASARGVLREKDIIESGLKDLFDTHNLLFIQAVLGDSRLGDFEAYDKSEIIWHNNPDGVVTRRFPTYKPVYEKETTFINIAHAHAHPVSGTTLAVKNIMGVMPGGYGHICDDWATLDIKRSKFMDNFNRDYRTAVEKSYVRHANMGFKHWDFYGLYNNLNLNRAIL